MEKIILNAHLLDDNKNRLPKKSWGVNDVWQMFLPYHIIYFNSVDLYRTELD
jgi:hypothetical protein